MFPFSKTPRLNVEPKKDPPMWRFYILILLLIVGGILKIKSTFFSKPTASKQIELPRLALPEDQAVFDRVTQHLLINSSQTPTIATVQNPEKLKAENSVFFAQTEVGDKLLLWQDRAVLYSPSKDVLLAVWPLNIVRTK